MTSTTYLIGVDTGGTYTDAAVIEAQGHKVIASAKSITTKGDLSLGVTAAITAAIAALPSGLKPDNIALVSVSTTLATNAVVEGHGSAVGVILIGFDQAMALRTGIAKAFPGMPVAIIGGGHQHNGEEAQPLDVAALEVAIGSMPVDAFAIASAFAVRNPAHEQQARDLVTKYTGKPATLSTELTSALDAPRRALTAVLNARLISRISMLIAAVRKSMGDLHIDCPLMIVKGDGTLALAERVALRPIETVLSGPAASLVGAAWLCGHKDFIMADMGGTTTDLGILLNGRPLVAEQGADVGGWRTMVKAIDVRTIGLGGDSEISIGLNGRMEVGPQRVAPISLIASRYQEVAAMLRPTSPIPRAARCMAASCSSHLAQPEARRWRSSMRASRRCWPSSASGRGRSARLPCLRRRNAPLPRSSARVWCRRPASRRRTPPMCWGSRPTGPVPRRSWRPGSWSASAT